MHDSSSIARYLHFHLKQLFMLDIHIARHGSQLRVAAVVTANPLPRGRSSNIALADPNPAVGPAWGPCRQGAADMHPSAAAVPSACAPSCAPH